MTIIMMLIIKIIKYSKCSDNNNNNTNDNDNYTIIFKCNISYDNSDDCQCSIHTNATNIFILISYFLFSLKIRKV